MSKSDTVLVTIVSRLKIGGEIYPEGPAQIPAGLVDAARSAGCIGAGAAPEADGDLIGEIERAIRSLTPAGFTGSGSPSLPSVRAAMDEAHRGGLTAELVSQVFAGMDDFTRPEA